MLNPIASHCPRAAFALALLVGAAGFPAGEAQAQALVSCHIAKPRQGTQASLSIAELFRQAEAILRESGVAVRLAQSCPNNRASVYTYEPQQIGEVQGLGGEFSFTDGPAGEGLELKHGTKTYGCTLTPYGYAVVLSTARFYRNRNRPQTVKAIVQTVNRMVTDAGCQKFNVSPARTQWNAFRTQAMGSVH